MTFIRKIAAILRSDKRPLCRLLGILIMNLPFDISQFMNIKIKHHDYWIKLHQSAYSVAIWHTPNYPRRDYELITCFLRANDCYVDVGANIGTTLIPAAKVIGSAGTAIGIEPHPRVFSYLQANMDLNNLNTAKLYNIAVGRKEGYVFLSDHKRDDTNSVQESDSGVKVKSLRLDDITHTIPRITLLKIDTEGFEKFVFEGAKETLMRTGCIYFEIFEENFNNFGYTSGELLRMLQELDFKLFKRSRSNTIREIDESYVQDELTENILAIKDIDNFTARTGWKVESINTTN